MLSNDVARIAHRKPSRSKLFLTAEEERELLIKAQAGDDAAREKLVLAFRPLVLRTIHSFRIPTHVGFDDVMSEGMFGLLEAVDHFDLSILVRFSTYAKWWVVNEVNKYINSNATIVTIGNAGRTSTIKKLLNEYSGAGAITSDTIDRVVAKTGMSRVMVEDTAMTLRTFGLDTVRTTEDGRDGDTFANTVPDLYAANPDDYLHEDRVVSIMQRAIGSLPYREREIVIARMAGDTLHVIAERFGITRERIRQVETVAHKKLARHAEVLRLSRAL